MHEHKLNGDQESTNNADEEFELMTDFPREDPQIVEQRRARNNEITKRLGSYLLKGYCMLGDACPTCECILLRTPEQQFLCVGCTEVDVEQQPEKQEASASSTPKPKKDSKKKSKKHNKKGSSSLNETTDSSGEKGTLVCQLDAKLKWAVDELSKTQSANRINAMCSVIIKVTEAIKALKEYEQISS